MAFDEKSDCSDAWLLPGEKAAGSSTEECPSRPQVSDPRLANSPEYLRWYLPRLQVSSHPHRHGLASRLQMGTGVRKRKERGRVKAEAGDHTAMESARVWDSSSTLSWFLTFFPARSSEKQSPEASPHMLPLSHPSKGCPGPTGGLGWSRPVGVDIACCLLQVQLHGLGLLPPKAEAPGITVDSGVSA